MPDKKASKAVISGLLQADGREIVQIAKDLGISKQRLSNYEKGLRFPDAEFVQLWKETFGHDLMDLINRSTDESTNVPRGVKKHTSVNKPTDNKEMDKTSLYQDIIESRTEYRLIPKIILDEYKIVHKAESDERTMAYREALDSKNRLIAELEQELADIRSGKLVIQPSQAPHSQIPVPASAKQ